MARIRAHARVCVLGYPSDIVGCLDACVACDNTPTCAAATAIQQGSGTGSIPCHATPRPIAMHASRYTTHLDFFEPLGARGCRQGYSRGYSTGGRQGYSGGTKGVLRSHLTSANPCSRLSVALMPRSSGNAQSCPRACMHEFACARAHAHATHAHTPTGPYVYTRTHSGLCAGRSGTGRVPRKAVPASPGQPTSRVFANA